MNQIWAVFKQGWDAMPGDGSGVAGISGSGASEPADTLDQHVGITAKAGADAAQKHL